ncbi:MAG: hypothetical protein IPK32_03820 [Verrucomicrobiaceae bacterium]|nr:hypothetical protein [Verrucomicrobiaceae bacterium]
MALICGYQIVRALADYPIWDGDAAGFWPHVKSYAETGRFNNLVFAPFLEWQTGYAHAENTYSHGFLTPMLLAMLSGGDYHRLHLVLALMHVVSTAFLLLAVNRVLPKDVPAWCNCLMQILVASFFNWSCYDPSRPESVTCAPICLFLWLALGCRITYWTLFFLGVGCALVFWFNPVPGVLLAAMISFLLASGKEACSLKWLRVTAFSVTIACAASIVFVTLYPGEWVGFIQGFYQVGRFNLTISELTYFAAWFVRKVEYPLLLLPLVACGVLLADRAQRNVRAGVDAFLSSLAGILFLLLCWRLGVRAPFRSYVFLPLLPVMMVMLMPFASSALKPANDKRLAWLAAIAIILTGVANGAMIATDLVRFTSYLSHGVPLHTTRGWMASVREKAPEAKIGFTGALFPCAEHDANAALFQPEAPRSEDFLFVQQVNTGRLVPPELEGYRLIEHNFVTHVPHFILQVGRITPGYSAALYERVRPF